MTTDLLDRPALVAGSLQLGPKLFEFQSFNDWVNHAQTAWKRAGVRSDHTLCIDTKGRHCAIGRDFMIARDDGSFPVSVYLRREDLKEVVNG